ncbi:hypothetical protein Poli38472_001876 [Pythium oligandrum]|uniref:Ankyrin repeat protein n=1 Tax=Pythium oligandrum TaxID=41045 RepID=A0A8K1FMT5_PYTOL|nr:hypothetical protein Poli38472_001876 [Pythium oligandrum]|eukprot:TMW69720.1 hypothetical protein Poli38472_001876 [Pythium oligandrum]
MVKMLLDYGANPNAVNQNGETALFIAAANGHVEITSSLIARGADPTITDMIGGTALHSACYAGKMSTVRSLLIRDLDVNVQNKEGYTPLHLAAARHTDVAELLLAYGANAKAKNQCGSTPLHEAIRCSKIPCMNLLANHVDLDEGDEDGATALFIAAKAGRRDAAKWLLEHGVDVNKANKKGSTPLHEACKNASLELVTLLLAHNAGVNVANEVRDSPLAVSLQWDAEKSSCVPILKTVYVLMSHGARVDHSEENYPVVTNSKVQGSASVILMCVQHWAEEQKSKRPLTKVEEHILVRGPQDVEAFLQAKNILVGDTL